MLLVEKENKIKVMLKDVEEFLDCNDYTPATYKTYSYHLKRFAAWVEKNNHDPLTLTGQTLKAYLNSRRWKPNTQRAAGNAALSFLRWRYGKDHPALRVKLPKDNAGPGRSLNPIKLDRLLAIFDTMKAVGWRNLSMLGLMVETGLRISEICRLELDYLNLEEQHLDVLAKGQKWREGVFSCITMYYLDTWLNAREKYAVPGCPFVFVSVNGKTKGQGMTPSGLRALFRKYGTRAQIGKLSPHDLRRTMATLLIKNGAPTRLVQELGSWADIRMVERYTRNLKPEQIETFSPILKSMRLFK
jgi:site-specific recombinase XerD